MNFDALSEPLSSRLAEGLSRLAAAARQLDRQAAKDDTWSPAQAAILRFAASRATGVRLTAAAEHLGVRKATASAAVAALIDKAMLRRRPDPRDARAVALAITAKGRAAVQRQQASFAPIVDGLGAAEQEALYRLVVKMIRQLLLRGLIGPQRTCATCRYFRDGIAPDTATPHFCAFVGAPMADRHLRIDCAEHQAAA